MNFPVNFICAGKEYTTLNSYVPAPYFRKTFEIKGPVKEAKMLICGLGYYELYINGANITKGYLAPYRSNPEDIVYYDEYRLANKLTAGKNVIGIILGNGIQNAPGAFIWDFEKATFRGAPKVAFSMEIVYENGETETVISDTDTLTAPSPIIFDDLHFGEYYDARLEIPGWNLPEFDDSDWKNSETAPTPCGEKRICEAEPIVVRGKLEPVSVIKSDEGYIYDFGVNSAGLYILKINGRPGQKIVMKFFETLVDGKPYLNNVRFHPEDRYQEDEYTCKGGETETYTPRFTYHGYRYALVSGITEEQATKELLTYLVMSSDIKEIGSFKCDNEIVNKLQEATVRSDISNFFYFPTDCPQREKNGWTADAALSAEQMLLNLTPEKSYREWMRSIYKAMNDQGQLPGIIPTTGWGYHWGNGPAWDCVIVYLPYYTYIYRGDKTIIEESATPLMRYLNYLYSRLDQNDLISIGLGDWCEVDRTESDYTAPLVVTDSIITLDIAEKSAYIFDVLGKEPQKQFALTLAERVKKAIRTHLIDKETLIVKGDCQTCQAMALYYGCFNEEEKPRAFDYLLKLIDDADGHMKTGVLGGRVIFRLLADYGKADLAFNMIVRPDFPSYGNWIERGATTLCEAFWREGGRIISMNHHFWGDISAWFYKYPGGINVNPTGRDNSNVDIRPHFIEKLGHVRAEHNTPVGRVFVEWRKVQGVIELTVDVAKEITGEIVLPFGYSFKDGTTAIPLKSGNYTVKKI